MTGGMSAATGAEPFKALRGAGILVVDDEENIRQAVRTTLTRSGAQVELAETAEEARRRIAAGGLDAAVIDIKLGAEDGLRLLSEIRETANDLAVVIITAHASVERAIEALRHGASDFLIKPFSPDQLRAALDRAIGHRRLSAETGRLRSEVRDRHVGRPVPSRSKVMAEVDRLVEKIADTHSTVLLTGESGTGKEVYARLIHEKSSRRAEPFVTVNCAAIPEGLLESELFGHTRGAFTGAVAERRGAFHLAAGGTLFLDEIGDLPLALQAKLLRAAETGEIQPLGGNRSCHIDTRIIAATNKDLETEARAGRFREDLFFRLNVISIRLPPLRERPEDIQPLTEELMRRFLHEIKRRPLRISEDAAAALSRHSWPGNVRELKNMIERALILTDGDTLTATDLALTTPRIQRDSMDEIRPLKESERASIESAIRAFGGNRSKAAEALGISSTTLWRKLKGELSAD